MITVVRTADFHDSKRLEVFTMAVDIATYHNDNLGAGNIHVLRNISGPVNEVRWVETYESLADFEVFQQKLQDVLESGELERFAEFPELFKNGRLEIFESVS